MKKLLIFVTMIVLSVVIVGCLPVEQQHIDVRNPAVVRNPIFSVEPRVNGTYTIWLVNDDVAAYCAVNKIDGEAALKAIRSKDATVIITYRNLLKTDKQYNTKPYNYDSNPNACIAEGADYIYYILSLEVLNGNQ